MIIENVKQLGDLIKVARKEMGFTQAELANFCNVGNRFIVELESGKPTLQFDKVLSIAHLVGLELAVNKRGN
jgi:y4mF family transcriptional regulator